MAICPICKYAAKEIQIDFYFGKTYRCPRHDEFDVVTQVLNSPDHMKAGSKQWEAALKRASEKATNGERPRIRLYEFYDWTPLPEASHDRSERIHAAFSSAKSAS